jgi:hypothetical protein
MKRVPALVFTSVLIASLIGLACWICSRGGVWDLVPSRRPTMTDGDPVWWTRVRFTALEHSLAGFSDAANDGDLEAIRRARTLEDFWGILHKKHDALGRPLVAFPLDADHLKDGWNQPYGLEIDVKGNQTAIRITSQVPSGEAVGGKAYVCLTFKGTKGAITRDLAALKRIR